MDQHCCDLLDGIVVIVYYYWISMELPVVLKVFPGMVCQPVVLEVIVS
jgi:hypothetical protein